MMYKFSKEKFMLIKVIFAAIVCIILLSYGSCISEGVLNGLYLCCQVLIPSLFPYMVVANFIVKSGLSDYLAKFCEKITSAIFGVSGKCGAIILLSLIGGYPVGAKGISALYNSKKIDGTEAEQLSYSLVSAGPGFLLIYIGTNTLNCPQIGMCILISQVLSVIAIGFINKIIFKRQKSNISLSQKKEKSVANLSFSDAIVESVKDCTYSTLEMCGTIGLFSGIISLFEINLQQYPQIFKYIATLLEVTTASNILCVDSDILLLAFATGFAGLSIHFQIFQALKNVSFRKWLFFTFRLFQGVITTTLVYVFLKIFNISVPTFSSTASINFSLSTSVLGSILLLTTGVCFLYNLKNNKN